MVMIDSEAVKVTLLVTDVLDNLAVPYAIGGSMASIVYGMMRLTMDVDIIADLKPEQVTPFIAALREQFYLDENSIREAVERRAAFNLIHLETMFKVDIFLPQERAFDRQQLARRVDEPVGAETEKKIWVLTAEDVVLAKLDWFRLGGEVSERQWRDILGVLKTQQARLDTAYLRQWAETLKVADLLEQALVEAEKEDDASVR
jgi:hypothetical protein